MGLDIVGHSVTKGPAGLQIESSEAICFVLDAPTNKKKKAKAPWRIFFYIETFVTVARIAKTDSTCTSYSSLKIAGVFFQSFVASPQRLQ